MKKLFCILQVGLLTLLCCGCQMTYTLYEDSFVYITAGNDGGFSENSSVSSRADNQLKTYNVHLCGPVPETVVSVMFEVVAGNGLAEGVDYKVETQGGRVRFAPGVFDKLIQIRYFKHEVDESLDNTLTIRLTGADIPLTLGMPGPSHKNIQHIITKFN